MEAKSRIRYIKGHLCRKGELRLRVIWEGLEELGPMWETANLIIERSPREIKEYILRKNTKSRKALLNRCPKLYTLFSSTKEPQDLTPVSYTHLTLPTNREV